MDSEINGAGMLNSCPVCKPNLRTSVRSSLREGKPCVERIFRTTNAPAVVLEIGVEEIQEMRRDATPSTSQSYDQGNSPIMLGT